MREGPRVEDVATGNVRGLGVTGVEREEEGLLGDATMMKGNLAGARAPV